MKRKFSWSKMCWLVLLVALVSGTGGCGTFMAHRMAQAPNTYPTWFAPKARVELGYSPKMMSGFPAHYVDVGPPAARLCYRVVEPADYHLKATSKHWVEKGEPNFDFSFKATVPGPTNSWTMKPRGTVLLLHGYGVAQFSMVPWALRLAEEGWRCVLVDLRGHGKSTGRQVYFGVQETYDLSQLLDKLEHDGRLVGPVATFGESYGAALALRLEAVDPRVRSAVAIAPYAQLSNAVMNIYQDYAGWLPRQLVKAGLRQLPRILQLEPRDLDTITVMEGNRVSAFFVAGAEDKVMPVTDVQRLKAMAAPGSEIVVVPEATHEAVTYFFDDIAPPVVAWLERGGGGKTVIGAK